MKKRYVLLVATVLILAFNSCDKASPNSGDILTFEFEYSNLTSYDINMEVYGEKQLLAKYSLKPFVDSVLLTGTINEFSIAVPQPFRYLNNNNRFDKADSIYLEFSNNRFITYNKGDSIFLYQAYEKIKLGDTLVIYKYNFTNEDYINAALID